EMGQAYPDLVRAEKLIEETLRLEETRFRKTLERGLSILDEKSSGLKKGDMFDGDTAFTLYDTYGFPLDLTRDALKSRGISVDQAAFSDAMERQREKARASWSGSGDTASENVWFPLREKLGATEFLGYETESAERGSLVAPDRLRFDFVHPKPITPEELARVEDIANDVVLDNDEVTTRLMGVDDAREAGARALFGEKYGDEVRVVSMGRSAREHGANALGWSVELCGGTHVRRTGDIGLISVTGESAVA